MGMVISGWSNDAGDATLGGKVQITGASGLSVVSTASHSVSVVNTPTVVQGASGAQAWTVGGTVSIGNAPTISAVQATASNLNATVTGSVSVVQGASGSQGWSVAVVNSPAVTITSGTVAASGTVTAIQGASGANPWSVQGDVAAGGTDANNPVKTGGVFNSTLPTLLTGQRGDTQLTSRGQTIVTISQGTAVANVNTAADGQAGAQALIANARLQEYNGATWDMVRGDTTNGIDVDVTRVAGSVSVIQATASALNATVAGSVSVINVPAVTINSGTVAASGTVTAIQGASGAQSWPVQQATASLLNATVTGSVSVIQGASGSQAWATQGNVAHDIGDAGNPLKIGGKANTVEPTAVQAADRVDAWFDEFGRLVVAPFHPQELTPVTATQSASAEQTIIAAPGAGSLHICSILVTNTSATLVRIDFKDGAAGTVRVTGALAANGGGFMWTPLRPWKLTATTALVSALSAGVTDVRMTVEYFTMP